MSYLSDLTQRLSLGLTQLPEHLRCRHTDYFCRRQQADGGFAGRGGTSDLYYTNFALRGLALLGELPDNVAERASRFCQERMKKHVSFIDFLSLIYSISLLEMFTDQKLLPQSGSFWQANTAALLEQFRRQDGGYAKGPAGGASSTYHTFLVALGKEILSLPFTNKAAMIRFVSSQRRKDGGFVEISPLQRSGTNPTAAAIGLLRLLGALQDDVANHAAAFLASMQTSEGGLRANTRIPTADLLSTFTGLLTLTNLGALNHIDVNAATRFVQSLAQPDGSFPGALWDTASDVEYTFYGLGALALTNEHIASCPI